MRQNFVAQLLQLSKLWLCKVWLGVVLEKNWALSVDQCWVQTLRFSVHLTDLLRILLRCNGFSKIQKAVVDPWTVTMTFWGGKFGFGASQSSHWVGHCQLSYKIYFSLHVIIQWINGSFLLCRIRWHFKTTIFFLASSWGTHLSSFFTFPICFKCWTIIDGSTLSSLAVSHVIVRRSALMTALN